MFRIVPEWTLVSETGPPHRKRFTWKLTMGEFSSTGGGGCKKNARQAAAKQMMKALPEEWKQKSKRPDAESNIQPSPKKEQSLD